MTSDVDKRRRVPDGRTDARGLLPCAARPRAGDRALTRLCTVCRPPLVRDLNPDLGEAREFAQAIHPPYPRKLLAYNCSPSFNWRRHVNDAEIASFQERLGEPESIAKLGVGLSWTRSRVGALLRCAARVVTCSGGGTLRPLAWRRWRAKRQRRGGFAAYLLPIVAAGRSNKCRAAHTGVKQ
jgi:hypothetical protein